MKFFKKNTPKLFLITALTGLNLCLLLGILFYLGPQVYWELGAKNNLLMPIVVSSQKQVNPGIPTRLYIPSIGVDAAVQYVDLAGDGSVGVPKGPYDVAWYKDSPRPGQTGSAIITGHYGLWRDGSHSVFDNLKNLKKGDKIYVADGKGISIPFTVIKIQVYDLKASVPEIFNKQDAAYLNLITCSGDWISSQKTFTQRLVVFTQVENSK